MGTIKKVYILHGWTYSLEKWEKFNDILKKNDIVPVFLKIPGLTEKSDQVWDINKYVDWLNKKIKGPVVLLGHSNGGRLAISFAYKYPNKVEKLILIDSAGIYHKNFAITLKRFLFGTISKIGRRITNSESLKRLLYKLAREQDYQSATPNMRKSMINLISVDLTSVLPKISTPTVIIWGDQDKITPIQDATTMNRLIKKSKLIFINGARHSPFYTHPEEVFNVIKNDI